MTRLDSQRPNPELDLPQLSGSQETFGKEGDVCEHLVADMLDLMNNGGGIYERTDDLRSGTAKHDTVVRTTTGCTTATSLRDGAG